jgi:hypothetical protein
MIELPLGLDPGHVVVSISTLESTVVGPITRGSSRRESSLVLRWTGLFPEPWSAGVALR